MFGNGEKYLDKNWIEENIEFMGKINKHEKNIQKLTCGSEVTTMSKKLGQIVLHVEAIFNSREN